MGIISVLYLCNIGVGLIEIIPDTIPYIGNLDEASAAILLVMCLRYFGIDLTKILEKLLGNLIKIKKMIKEPEAHEKVTG